MKRACTGTNAASPNDESVQEPRDLPSDVWRIIIKCVVHQLYDEADALDQSREGDKPQRGHVGGWGVVYPRQVTALALVNRATASVAWQALYCVAGNTAFEEATLAAWMAKNWTQLRWVNKRPLLQSTVVLNVTNTAWFAHMDMLNAIKRTMLKAITGERCAEAKGLVSAMRALRDDTSIVDRIYSIGSDYTQLANNCVPGYGSNVVRRLHKSL